MPHVSKIPFLFVSLVIVSMFVYWMVLSWYSKKNELFFLDVSKVNLFLKWPFV